VKRAVADVVGAVVEAWAELRVNKLRVLLSLVGVAVAVAALTGVVALGGLAEQSSRESAERNGGRPANYYVNAYSTGSSSPDADAIQDAFVTATERYGIDQISRVAYGTRAVQLSDGVTEVGSVTVDVPYGEMHRVVMTEGSWFTDADTSRLAPAVIVNEVLWRQLGSPPLSTHPTLLLRGADSATVVVTGVSAAADYESASLYLLPVPDHDLAVTTYGEETPQYEMWLPPETSDALSAQVASDMEAALGDGFQVDVSRQDYAAGGDADPFGPIKLIITGVGVLVLLLGGLGLVNIALVTVRQRIREIGVRRSFGATAPRVFFSVMLESVVGTVVAGAVGVMAAVLVVENPTVQGFIAQGSVSDLPPFPVEAALIGLASATAIGAVAGVLPALVAIRVKVIDAIRY
jgi:putative ABC transport system permease protein